ERARMRAVRSLRDVHPAAARTSRRTSVAASGAAPAAPVGPCERSATSRAASAIIAPDGSICVVARSRVACIVRRLGWLVALAAVSGCGGKVIHLGDGTPLADGGPCPHAQVAASQVLWIGDSWVLNPGNQHTAVQASAVAAGAIAAGDAYTIAA